MEEMKFHTI